MFAFLLRKLLLLYKNLVPPHISAACRYRPTCSMYMYDAVGEHGAIIGAIMGVWRILRCNPWSKGGTDPVKFNLKGKVKWVL